MPSGVTSPMPVTTTRLMPGRTPPGLLPWRPTTRSAMRLDEADRVLDGHDLLGRVIRDFAPEFLFEGHHQLDRVKAVGPQIVDKAGILGDLGFVDAEMLDDDLLDPLGNVAHSIFPRLRAASWLNSARSGRPFAGSAVICPHHGPVEGAGHITRIWPA